jgi:hypothetical protein
VKRRTNEYGEHDADECYLGLLGKKVKSECQFGKYCGLLIEADVEDAEARRLRF